MPKKSIETANSKEREPRNIVKDYPVKQSIFYTNIDESKSKLTNLKTLKDWGVYVNENEVTLTVRSRNYDVVSRIREILAKRTRRQTVSLSK